jgi:hypothetical protein
MNESSSHCQSLDYQQLYATLEVDNTLSDSSHKSSSTHSIGSTPHVFCTRGESFDLHFNSPKMDTSEPEIFRTGLEASKLSIGQGGCPIRSEG